MIELRRARFADALNLAPRLRFEDAREIAATWGMGARQGLLACLLHSDRSFGLWFQDSLVALWGVSGSRHRGFRIGIPWMLAGEALFRSRAAVRYSRRWVRHLLLDYDVLTNLTHADNGAHRRWLGWCGFDELCVRPRYGAEGRPFVEFLMVNPHCRSTLEDVRRALLQRQPPPGMDAAAVRMAELAVRVFDGPDGDDGALALLLGEAGDDGHGPRLRCGLVNLLRELLLQRRRACRLRSGGRHGPVSARSLDALSETVWEMEQMALLDAARGDAAAAPWGITPLRRHPVAALEVPAIRELSPLVTLLRRYDLALTWGGRCSRAQGYRLRAAAAGSSAVAVRRPLGVDIDALHAALQEHLLLRSVAAGGLPPLHTLAQRRDALFGQPVDHGAALGRMAVAANAMGGVMAPVLRAVLDRCAVARDGGADAQIATLADAWNTAARIADETALALVPALRLGLAVTDYGERHTLYRLLRLALWAAAADAQRDRVQDLAMDEVAALLTVARLEDALLSAREDAVLSEATALARGLAMFGEVSGKTGLDVLLGLLLPLMAQPVVHSLQRAPALLAWHLAASGTLGETLCHVSAHLPEEPSRRSLWLSKLLRRAASGVAMVDFQRHLDSILGRPCRQPLAPVAPPVAAHRPGTGSRAGRPPGRTLGGQSGFCPRAGTAGR